MHTNVLRPGWRAFRDLVNTPSRAPAGNRFPASQEQLRSGETLKSPESLATRCQDALGMTVWCCMRSVEFTPLQRSSS